MAALAILMTGLSESLLAQEKFTLRGYVIEAGTGEFLPGANVYDLNDPVRGTTSNNYGYYSLTLEKGAYQIVFSYLGFESKVLAIALDENKAIDVELSPGGLKLEEIEVVASEEDEAKNVESTEMGTVALPTQQLKQIPALLGEIDILKTIQLLPGVSSAGEGSAGFYVRGGGPDQNLVLLDEAVVYNSGHMLGFFSVFNADALKNTTLIKGSMPANYGGRLSSVLDIQMKEGNDQYFEMDGGIGLISSRFTAQGPIVKNKSSFIISGRRTYVFDIAQPYIDNTDLAGTNYYFYDVNAKVNYKFSQKDRLFISSYFGRDVLDYFSNERDFLIRMPYGNATATLRWNHLISNKIFFNISAIYNDYDFSFRGEQETFQFKLNSGVRDFNFKFDMDYYPSSAHAVKFGMNYTYHKLTPNIVTATNGDVDFNSEFTPRYANEYAVYAMDDINVAGIVGLQLGLRVSRFDQIGPYTSKIDGRIYDDFQVAKTYYGFEPRGAFRLGVSPTTAVKGGVSMTSQYIHLVSNSNSTLPTDVWVPSSELVKPQESLQYSLGFFQNWAQNDYEMSIEVYYKNMRNQIEYRENFVDNTSAEPEDDFVFGSGRALGTELFLRKNKGNLTGWIGYTLSRTDRKFPDIEEGRIFPAKYDRTHDVSLVLSLALSKKVSMHGSFVYGTGNAFTPIRSIYFVEQSLNTRYGPRNSQRQEAYHRADFSLIWVPKPTDDKRFKSSWTFSVYNFYNRKNPFFTYIDYYTSFQSGNAGATAYKVTLFPVIPSITWNFSWSGEKEKEN